MNIKSLIPVFLKKSFLNYESILFQRLFTLFLPVSKKVLFESFDGKQYSDNPRAISEMLHEMDASFQIVWVFRDIKTIPTNLPTYIKIVKRNSIAFYKEIVTSFAYIRNTQFDKRIIKRFGKQLFIQSWHGDRGYKKALFQSNPNREDINDFRVVDYCMSGSKFGTNFFREGFRYEGEILESGCPRNDVLLSPGNASARCHFIKDKYGIPNNTQILLYAPTFRDGNTENQHSLVDINDILIQLRNKTSTNWVCCFRSHSNVRNGLDIKQSNDIIDVSDEGDAADLLCAADFLITDYSSIAGDYMLRRKPIILAIFDEKEFEKNSREFLIRPADTGLFTAKNNEEILKIIELTDLHEYERRSQLALDKYKTHETGCSSQQIVSIIIKKFSEYNL